jgi:enoyl-CoA hydratase/carnithine racemase
MQKIDRKDAHQAATKKWEYLLVDIKDKVGVITLNRPKALNALSTPLFTELNQVLKDFDVDPRIKTIVLTGGEKAFAAGADIKEMAKRDYIPNYKEDFLASWTDITRIRKPIIAAVNGFAVRFHHLD